MEAVRENSSLADDASSICSSIISFLTRKVDCLTSLRIDPELEASSEPRRFYPIADIIDSLGLFDEDKIDSFALLFLLLSFTYLPPYPP